MTVGDLTTSELMKLR